MRRPTQHTRRPAAPGWTHPYTGLPGIAVFYNDGGHGDGNQPPVPSPADLANRAPQTPATPPGPQPVIDKETGVAMTQDRFNRIMTRQYEKSRNAAYREMAESLGLTFDPETFDLEAFKATLKEGHEARQQVLTDEQRRTEELNKVQQAVQAEKAKAEQERAAIQAERRALAREQALTRLGALDQVDEQGNVTAPNLQDALAMLERDLRDTPDADATALTTAAEALKKRRPELFGAPTAPQTLPPAPSGGPAGGNAPRQPASTKDALQKAARKRAEAMGLRHDNAA
ncbi:putative Vegetative cell wall protein gp1 (Hydroxyproline-rich glycoprotein 1) (plasmid) [Streptomyces ambofaciens ATCC 23877]|uniref:Putative Vegetative cell wall protein gp1 (Hydroxyproline-rich glycoprotein 1) n=1 Tax=Streptomyces ambofaciens (strain ATCC 23877 / 3486 / DSM 40053 / JCM 4204 / NBRC 12836 / NRRL B-2516) TaxID=278992 RepID=A0A0K2B6R0_STRA7|nr:hypothetical protein [Streptomyces ambofaciens]AKZ60841.1 putative Vegetative cell wall protein gp1 (Hydroxyproline-rich glycoprotein 1) [Streptomyces ambofaciens ATCC 23877]